MSDHCGSFTEEGNAVCIPGLCSCSSESRISEPIPLSLSTINESYTAASGKTVLSTKTGVNYVEGN